MADYHAISTGHVFDWELTSDGGDLRHFCPSIRHQFCKVPTTSAATPSSLLAMTKIPSPKLYRLAQNRLYADIPNRLESHPEDLQWVDRYGNSALHILCQQHWSTNDSDDLLKAVAAIARFNPQCVAQTNIATMTPLHLACEKRLVLSRRNSELILLLIRNCPDAVSVRTNVGFKTKTPFHIACESNAPIEVLQAMLEINPLLASEPYIKKDIYNVAENPLQLLWKTARAVAHSSSHAQLHSHKKDDIYEKMALLLRAAHYGRISSEDNHEFRLLSAACSVQCPREYFSTVLLDHIDQVSQPDEKGLLPLHYAVRHASVEAQSYTQFVVSSLLELDQAAASVPDEQDRLVLHVAVGDSVLTWHTGGIRELVFANPEALRVPDPTNDLVPVLLSAVHANRSRLHLSTTYELLLAAPDVVKLRAEIFTESTVLWGSY